MRAVVVLLLVLGTACGNGTGGPPKPVLPVPDAGNWWDASLGPCLRPNEPAPRTIWQVVERINALPRPVSVACVVASLPRPLALVATTSVFSAQPADGRRSPRVFMMTDHLILSVVLAGNGAKLLEFGEVMSEGRTLKGELPFPITAEVPFDAPFTHVLMGSTQTNCALCHRTEMPHPSIDGGFVSAAFRPDPGNLVPIAELKQELGPCDPMVERDRCELLVALLGLGAVQQGAFSKKFELFLQ